LELRPVRNGRGKRCRSDRVISLPTANGGIARAAYARAVKAGLNVEALLKNASLSLAQVSRPEIRIPVLSQVKFLDEVAAKLNDNFLGIRLARSIDLRELGLVYYVLASSEDLRGALTRLARYSGIHNEGIHIGLGTGADMTVSSNTSASCGRATATRSNSSSPPWCGCAGSSRAGSYRRALFA
jgi:hypothetical protein